MVIMRWTIRPEAHPPLINVYGSVVDHPTNPEHNGFYVNPISNYTYSASYLNTHFATIDYVDTHVPSTLTTSIVLDGTSSGEISILPQADAGTYNFNLPTTAGTAGQVLTSQGGDANAMTWTSGGGGGGSGTVTSVGLTVPSFLSVSGSPVTSSGTLAVTGSSTGSGSVVLQTSPALVTPAIGAATGTTLNLTGSVTSAGLVLNGSSSGTVSVVPQAAAGTYNFSLPTTAGSAGQFLTSQGAGAMTWTPAPTVFSGDAGSGGTAGLVPAPPAGSAANGNFLSASGAFAFVDQSLPRVADFALVRQVLGPNSVTKFQNVVIYTFGNKTYACISGGLVNGTLTIFDVSNPMAPLLLGSNNYLGSYNTQVATISGVVYAFIPSNGGSTLFIVNITNPSVLVNVGSIAITGGAGALYSCRYNAGYVYIATQSKGLTVVDVGGGSASLAAPVQIYQEGGTLNKSFGIEISGSTLYTTNFQTTFPAAVRYLKTWTFATPSAPVLVNTFPITGGPLTTSVKSLGLTISGNTAFVTDTNQNVIHLIDITTPANPVYLSYAPATYAFNSGYVGVAQGNFLYIPSGSNVTNGGAIDCFDISVLTVPQKVATTYSGQASSVFGGIAINGGYIYVADYQTGTSTLDVFTMPQTGAVIASATVAAMARAPKTIALLDNQASPVAIVAIPVASAVFFNYSIAKNGHVEAGVLAAAFDGTTVATNTTVDASTGATGVTLSVTNPSGTILQLGYTSTSTGAAGTFKYVVTNW